MDIRILNIGCFTARKELVLTALPGLQTWMDLRERQKSSCLYEDSNLVSICDVSLY
jgi:hypothetical protein